MSEHKENLGSFFKENTKLAKDYFETKLEIYRLSGIRVLSKSAGYLIWIIISIFLFFLFAVFVGIVIGIWLSNLTGSYLAGFGITTGIMLLLIILLTVLRKTLFVNPIIKSIIGHAEDLTEEDI